MGINRNPSCPMEHGNNGAADRKRKGEDQGKGREKHNLIATVVPRRLDSPLFTIYPNEDAAGEPIDESQRFFLWYRNYVPEKHTRYRVLAKFTGEERSKETPSRPRSA